MREKNRWLIALSAVAIHLSIGSAYAYSVFKGPLKDQLGWENSDVTFAFSIAIFCLGMSAAFFGPFVEKNGPRKSALVAATLFASGLIGTGFAVKLGSLPMFYITYGVLGGMGLGFGYISPVSTLVKWFPDRRGLATGMAVFGFGAGAMIAAPVAEKLMTISSIGISNTFFIMGAVYFTFMALGASYISRPPEGWSPKGMNAATGNVKKKVTQDLAQLTSKEAVKTKRFWLLWLMMFINISVGLMLISEAAPMATSVKIGMTPLAAASMVGVMGMFNGGGRIGWSSASDYIGRTRIFTVFFAISLVSFLILPNVSSALIFQALMFVSMTIYGGGFAVLPAFIGDLFGTKQLGAIHGLLLTSWSMAGVFGPLMAAFIKEQLGTETAFYVFAGLITVGIAVSVLMAMDINKIKQKQSAEVTKVSA